MAAPNSNPKTGAPLPMLGGQPNAGSPGTLRMLNPTLPASGLMPLKPNTVAPTGATPKLMPIGTAAPVMPKLPATIPTVTGPMPTFPPRVVPNAAPMGIPSNQMRPESIPAQQAAPVHYMAFPAPAASVVAPVAVYMPPPASAASPPPPGQGIPDMPPPPYTPPQEEDTLSSMSDPTPPPKMDTLPEKMEELIIPPDIEAMETLVADETGYAAFPDPRRVSVHNLEPALLDVSVGRMSPQQTRPAPAPAPAPIPTIPQQVTAPSVSSISPQLRPVAPQSAPVSNPPKVGAPKMPSSLGQPAPAGGLTKMPSNFAPKQGAAAPKIPMLPGAGPRPAGMSMLSNPAPAAGQPKMIPIQPQPKVAVVAPATGAPAKLNMIPSGQPADNSLSSLLADAHALGLMAMDQTSDSQTGSISPRTRDSIEPSPPRFASPTPERPPSGGPTSSDMETEIDLKRRQIVTEILETERKYKNYLQVLIDFGVNPIKKKKLLTPAELKEVFINIESLASFHEMFFAELDRVVSRWHMKQCVGDIFLKFATGFQLYIEYINGFDKSDAALKRLVKKSKDLGKVEQELQNFPGVNRLDFASFLIMPVQRLPRYLLLLDDLLKRTDSVHPDFDNLSQAIKRVKEISDHVNMQKGVSDSNQRLFDLAKSLTGFRQEALLKPSRVLVDQKDIIIAGTKGIFSVICVIFNDAYMIISKSTKGLTFIGIVPIKYARLQKINIDTAKSRLKVAGKPLELGKYAHWMQLSAGDDEDYFFAVPSEADKDAWIAQFETLKRGIVDRYYRHLDSTSGPAGRHSHSLAVGMDGKHYVIGGYCRSTFSKEVWTLDYDQRVWSQIDVSNVPAMVEHTATTIGTRIFVFGGVVDGEYSNKLFSFDISTYTWAEVAVQGTPPSARARHSAAAIGSKLYIFGGVHHSPGGDVNTFYNDIHVYDSDTNTWSAITPSASSDAPAPRASACVASRGTQIFVWGGINQEASLGDLFVFDTMDSLWMQPRPVGFSPSPRSGCAVAVLDQCMIVAGGENKSTMFSDVFLLNMDTLMWTKLQVPVSLPARTRWAAALIGAPAIPSGEAPLSSVTHQSLLELRNATLLLHGGKTSPDAVDPKPTEETICIQLLDKWLMDESGINSQSDKLYIEAQSKRRSKHSEYNTKLAVYNFATTNIVPPTHSFVFMPPSKPAQEAWDGSMASLSIVASIGSGPVSDVAKATISKSGQLAAIKMVSLKAVSDPATASAHKKLMATIEDFKRMRHPNLVALYGAVQESGLQIWLISEICSGSLRDYLDRSEKTLSERQIAAVVLSTLTGLHQLHQLNLVHKWLRASNIMLTDRGEVKLADYAVSDMLTAISSHSNEEIIEAHRPWTATDSTGGAADDIYSLGITIIELCENVHPFNALQKPKKFSQELQDFVAACLAPAAQRPDVATLLRHPFLTQGKPESLKDIADFIRKSRGNPKLEKKASSRKTMTVEPAPVVVLDENPFAPPKPQVTSQRPPSQSISAHPSQAALPANLEALVKSMVQQEVANHKRETQLLIDSLQSQLAAVPQLVQRLVAEEVGRQRASVQAPAPVAAPQVDYGRIQALVDTSVGSLRQDTEQSVVALFERIQALEAELHTLRSNLAVIASSALGSDM